MPVKGSEQIPRLLVGHSEFNAIGLIWAQAKNEVATKNIKFNLTSVKELITNALAHVTPDNWRNAIAHAKKVEDAFRKHDFPDPGVTTKVDRMIISLSNSDSSSSDDSYFSDSSND